MVEKNGDHDGYRGRGNASSYAGSEPAGSRAHDDYSKCDTFSREEPSACGGCGGKTAGLAGEAGGVRDADCLPRGGCLKIAVYGKGGIGKSTVTSHLAAAFAVLGKRVIQIGCDPKADSTINLLGGRALKPVMNYLREEDEDPDSIEEISETGFGGILCIETGGPTPGLGCAGRGIIATFQLLEDLELFESYQPDIVLYDVLGDVVCGGFAAPIREGYAEHVLIVTSGEKMALYAAGNIASAVQNFEDRSYARIKGIILNHRNVVGEDEKVREFAASRNLEIVGEIPRSDDITRFEDQGMTTIEGDPNLPVSRTFLELAKKLL